MYPNGRLSDCSLLSNSTSSGNVDSRVSNKEPVEPAVTLKLNGLRNDEKTRFTDTSWQIHRTWRRDGDSLRLSPPLERSSTSPAPSPAPLDTKATSEYSNHNSIYDTIMPSLENRGDGGADVESGSAPLDVWYVAARVLAVAVRGGRRALRHAARMLADKHGEHYMVFEVDGDEGECGQWDEARRVFGRARRLGWARGLAPPLDHLCAACKHVDSWLAAHTSNVAVLLSWGDSEQVGVVVSAYARYSGACGGGHALDRHAMRRYLHDRLPVFRLPSNKRYVETFGSLVGGRVRVNPAPLQLTHVTAAAALGEPHRPALAFLKVYENFVCVYTSGMYLVSGGEWSVETGQLSLRGDVAVRAYRRPTGGSPQERTLVFACQFHTCAITDNLLTLTKKQLDHAAHDPSFPCDGVVELVFARGGEATTATGARAAAPATPLRSGPDALAHADSLEHLRPLSGVTDDGENNGCGEGSSGEGAEAAHTFGPLDGSIYARVVRGGAGAGSGEGAGGGEGATGAASPLSASMDSGISSAGRRAAPTPPDELDALLGDMLRTVSALPDPPPPAHDIPYHARVDSAPFTYGAPPLRPGMLRPAPAAHRLASPELVRRALTPAKINRIIDDDDDEPESPRSPLRSAYTPARHEHSLATTNSTKSSYSARTPNGDIGRSDRASDRANIARRILEENGTWHGVNGWHESGVRGGASTGLTWLQRQQQKLRERREARERMARLPLEWDAGPTRYARRSASHRIDGYTSDTTAFADDEDELSVPLYARGAPRTPSTSPHPPTRSSSRKFMFEKLSLREWSPAPAAHAALSVTEPANYDTIVRERTSSWSRAESRSCTPAFPTHPRTPYTPTAHHARALLTPTLNRKERESSPESEYRIYSGSEVAASAARRGPAAEPQHVAPERVRFARDTSHYWYKPNITRDDAVAALEPLEEGSFIVRDSNSFPGAFGLAVRVRGGGGVGVRHFLVESVAQGVRLRGCADEPVFSSLSALVYQHTVTPLALPVPLRLPERDPLGAREGGAAAARALLAGGAACHVLLLGSHNTEALTGPAAVARAVTHVLKRNCQGHVVHFKVFGGGVTLTDASRALFFRRHYPAAGLSHAGLDPDSRRYTHRNNGLTADKRIFAFVARATPGSDNECHVFAELDPDQPATAIVNFLNKTLLTQNQKADII